MDHDHSGCPECMAEMAESVSDETTSVEVAQIEADAAVQIAEIQAETEVAQIEASLEHHEIEAGTQHHQIEASLEHHEIEADDTDGLEETAEELQEIVEDVLSGVDREMEEPAPDVDEPIEDGETISDVPVSVTPPPRVEPVSTSTKTRRQSAFTRRHSR